jgi:hypothetical protein
VVNYWDLGDLYYLPERWLARMGCYGEYMINNAAAAYHTDSTEGMSVGSTSVRST